MKIPTNEGALDRTLRIVAGLAIGWVFVTGTLTGVAGGVALAVSLVLLLTGITGFCPLYALLHVSTAHHQPREEPGA